MFLIGKVAVSIKVMPKQDANITEIKKKIECMEGFSTIKEVPIAFGLKMLEAVFVFDDRAGANTDEIENKIREIDGVSSVETGDAALV